MCCPEILRRKYKRLAHFRLYIYGMSVSMLLLDYFKASPPKIWIWLPPPPLFFFFFFVLNTKKIERYPTQEAQTIFSFRMSSRKLFHLKIREDGRLELWSHGQPPPGVITKSNFPKSRWLHITVVHYPHQGSHPNLEFGLFLASLDLPNRHLRILHRWRSD